ncbi:hypothetical protein [Thiopseudomonas denitrificans]|uniref:Uncharacterized protein n=1 Tax=Thiopseudomonas denitrificans TaxID=1501432 RepID=A0A4R6TYD3_9GAMM|nr:hypothetical protein [Thiopseudomonas denitrificans]TDQ38940.1 hypothetical protein DFQ45_103106 [Thiopseudomonas denitrificans]
MRALAEYIMRGRRQAALAVGLTAALPLLFWLSAAGASLVLLRKGLAQSASIIAWALVPAVVWALYGDPYVLLVIGGSLLMAQVLRESASWLRVLLASLVVGLGSAWVLSVTFADSIDQLAGLLQESMPGLFDEAWQQLDGEAQARLLELLRPVLTGLMAAVAQMLALAALVVARYWQALLYNPGGFGQEFRSIRLPAAVAGLLVMGMLLAPRLSAQAAVVMPLCAIPLGVAGVALVHGVVARYNMGRFPLIGFYVGMFLFAQLLYPLLIILALADSVFDFRGLRALSKNNAGPTDNGE